MISIRYLLADTRAGLGTKARFMTWNNSSRFAPGVVIRALLGNGRFRLGSNRRLAGKTFAARFLKSQQKRPNHLPPFLGMNAKELSPGSLSAPSRWTSVIVFVLHSREQAGKGTCIVPVGQKCQAAPCGICRTGNQGLLAHFEQRYVFVSRLRSAGAESP